MTLDPNGIYYIFNTNIIGIRIHKNGIMDSIDGVVWGSHIKDHNGHGYHLFAYHYNINPEECLVRLK